MPSKTKVIQLVLRREKRKVATKKRQAKARQLLKMNARRQQNLRPLSGQPYWHGLHTNNDSDINGRRIRHLAHEPRHHPQQR